METALFLALGLIAGVALAAIAFYVARTRTPAIDPVSAQLAEQRIVELGAKVQAMGELLARAQTQLQTAVNTRLDSVTQNLQTSLDANKKDTFENLDKLSQRLAVIDSAQKNITELASQVTSLQSVLANKQTRGAFGQAQMEAIVQDRLPKGAYAFQHTLTNGKRPDCCVFLLDKRPLVIDAKFPLEGVTAYRDAKSEEERKAAAQRLRTDVTKHITDIAEKYLIPGETYETALMFVPSESIYAELIDGFDDVVQKAHRERVMLVSPMLLMATIQLVQHIRKDARMREAADQIQAEVGRLLKDVGLLGDRVRKLQTHFNQSSEDIRQAIISVEKIETRGQRIALVEVGDSAGGGGDDDSNVIPAPMRRLEAGE
jgi:DNA recombination protein RmuC